MRFVVLGGGCYGTFYGRQLLRARNAGAIALEEAVLVDRDAHCRARSDLEADPAIRFVVSDWDTFLDRYLDGLDHASTDMLVTPPFTPHLSLAWLLRRLSERASDFAWQLEPFRRMPGTPFQRQQPGGPLVVSHADWICPVNCIEPATCPKTRGPRFWDLDATVRAFAPDLEEAGQRVAQIHLFHCHHVAYGVGAFPAARVVDALNHIESALETESAGTLRFLIGTISHCHGALNLLTAVPGTDSVSTRQITRSADLSNFHTTRPI